MSFLSENVAEFYAIRDKSRVGGKFQLKVKEDDVLTCIKGYDLFSINVSSANYWENQLLVGEIEIFSDNEVYLTLSTNQKYSVRDALRDPSFNYKTNLLDKKLDDIPYFNDIYLYIVKNKLKNVIIEFSLFDIPVGVYNENIVIYELRTNY